MKNPYSAPEALPVPSVDGRNKDTGTAKFLACYAGAFGVALAMWFLSKYVRRYDLLELPMLAFLFPLAMFIDPGDAMIGQTLTPILGACFWGAVIPIALRKAKRTRTRLVIALGIVGGTGIASVVFAIFAHALF